jgi:hypothetical protein
MLTLMHEEPHSEQSCLVLLEVQQSDMDAILDLIGY